MKISKTTLNKLKDPYWRINHLYKIKDKQGNLVTFKLNDFQKAFIKQRAKHRRNKIIKYRQGGLTTFRGIELLDKALWVPGMTCAIVAHEREAVTKIFRIVKRAFDGLPEALKPEVKYNNKSELQFVADFTGRPLDSNIYVALKLRSGTVQYLHISESAFIEGEKRLELNAGSKETVPLDGDITEETTANGYNEFHGEVEIALRQKNNKSIPDKYKTRVYFFSWLENKEYRMEGITWNDLGQLDDKELRLKKLGADSEQLAWRRWKIQEYGQETLTLSLSPEQVFMQEYPATREEAFQASGGLYFEPEDIKAIETKEPEIKGEIVPNLMVWKGPEEGKTYAIGVDPSKNKGIDNSCIDVWCVEDREQVAQWYGYIDPDILAEYTMALGVHYNGAFVVVENNLQTTILALKDIYPLSGIYKYVREGKTKELKTEELGYPTTSKTRPLLIDNWKKDFRENNLIINSPITKAEMWTFITKQNGKVEHAEGKHDDALFAAFLAKVGVDSKPGSVNITWI